MTTGILLMAYGGPASLDEIEPYLLDVRGGRPLTPELLKEIRERYRVIGGKSPLLGITEAQATALEARLTESGTPCRAYVGMRHWHPYIKETMGQIVKDGVTQVVGLCMAPHYSRMSIGAYQKKLAEANISLGDRIAVTCVESWNDHPLLLQAIAEKVEEALTRFNRVPREKVQIIFTAHSLPERILAEGDPYPKELDETVQGVVVLLRHRVGPVSWRFAYQSQGRTGEPWLGPSVEDVLDELSRTGHRHVLIAPVGFVADHIEILYDIDVLFKKLAASQGMQLERTASLNTTPHFIDALASIVQAHLPPPQADHG